MLGGLRELGRVFGRRNAADESAAFRWSAPGAGRGLLARWFGPATGPATVFHVTHHKAGSQWINRILHAVAYDRLVHPEPDDTQFLDRPIQPGRVYPTVYVTREQFEGVRVPAGSRRFVVIRDLRDTLVSAYFSIKHSHAMAAEHHLRLRGRLRECAVEEGLSYLLDAWLPERAAVQRSWLGGPDDVLKYEDMLRNDEEILPRVLLGHCRLDVSPEKLREVILANRFEALAKRKPGQEDVSSHERKGIAGDWKNYFTDRLARRFKDRFGELLVAAGYERDDRW